LRSWALPGLVLVIPTIALLTAVPRYRINQIPEVSPGFALEPYTGPMSREERATLDLYRQAMDKAHFMPSAAWKGKPRASDEEVVALVLKASRGTLQHPLDEGSMENWLSSLPALLEFNAAVLEKNGKLDEAGQRYLAAIRIAEQLRECCFHYDSNRMEIDTCRFLREWAGRPSQTPERILAVERELERLTSNLSPDGPIKLEHLRLRRILEGDPAKAVRTVGNKQQPLTPQTMLWLHLPWERTRALRLLNYLTTVQIEQEDPHSESILLASGWARQPQRSAELLFTLQREFRSWEWWEDGWQSWQRKIEQIRQDTLAAQTACNATRLVLALEAWKLRHGTLPKTLDELVGSCLDRLPTDPYSGESFLYFRTGLKIPLRSRGLLTAGVYYHDSLSQEIPADTPFLWATGPGVQRNTLPAAAPDRDAVFHRYTIIINRTDMNTMWQTPQSEYDVWESGWAFPIP